MTDFIALGIIVVVIAVAIAYIIKEKKSGVKCIGCPAGGSCSGNCGGQSGCAGNRHSENSGEN